jgi:hypothetical protein
VSSPLVPPARVLRLQAGGVLASRSLLAATAVWLGLLAAVYAADAGPPRQAMAFTAAALFPAAAWAAAAALAGGSPDLRAVLTAADGRGRVLGVDLLLSSAWVGGATVVGVLAPVVFDPHPASGADIAVGVGLHLACGSAGVGLATLLHAAGTGRGVQAAVVVLAGLLSGQVAALPPIGSVLAAWGSGRDRGTAAEVWSFVGPVLLAAVLVTGTAALPRRRA